MNTAVSTEDLISMIEDWEFRMEDARKMSSEARRCYDPKEEAKWEAFAQGLEECSMRLRQKIKAIS